MNRNVVIAGSVVLLHVAALWALQSGLLHRVAEIVVPAEVLSEFISPPPPPAPAEPQRPAVTPAKPRAQPQPLTRAQPQPAATPVQTPAPLPLAPAEAVVPATPAPTPAPVAAPPAPPQPPAPPRLELPSSSADYLNNPRPAYPAMSKRLGEQGKVVVRVLIGTDGTAQQAEIKTSSGFDRLDQAALATVLKWRYVPGKRGGVPEAMWFNVPINFVLE